MFSTLQLPAVTRHQLPAANLRLDSCSGEAFGFAPGIEYSFTPNLGVLLGTRVTATRHNIANITTPALAINFVH